MKLGYEGEILIKHYEDCLLEAYQDGGGVWTIGWGNTYYEDGRKVKEGDKIPQWRADELFKHISKKFSHQVLELTEGVELKQWQFDALVSFVWNIGYSRFSRSTLRKVILDDPYNHKAIDHEFGRWIYDNGEEKDGLIARRKSESLLYRKNELKFFN